MALKVENDLSQIKNVVRYEKHRNVYAKLLPFSSAQDEVRGLVPRRTECCDWLRGFIPPMKLSVTLHVGAAGRWRQTAPLHENRHEKDTPFTFKARKCSFPELTLSYNKRATARRCQKTVWAPYRYKSTSKDSA
ncbi:V-set domain-containing T-cell activation inhibitor 1, partial [Frankliniella fusca]